VRKRVLKLGEALSAWGGSRIPDQRREEHPMTGNCLSGG